MPLGDRLRQLRESRGLTQQQLAGREFSKSYISLLEHNKARPSVDTLALLAARLGTTVDGVVAGDGHAPEVAAHALLAVAWDASRRGDDAAVNQLLSMINYLASTYDVREAAREATLLAAQIAFERHDYERAVADASLAEAASRSAADLWRAGRALALIGRTHLRRRAFDQAVSALVSALDAFRQSRAGRDPARVEALIALASAHVYLGDFDRAAAAYTRAAASYVAKNHAKLRGRALWGLGVVSRKRGEFDAAVAQLQRAKDAFEAGEEPVDLARVLQNLGQVYLEIGKPKMAMRYLQQAFRIAERLDHPVDRASIMTEIARAHYALGELSDSVKTARRARDAAEEAGDPVEVAEANVVLGRGLLVQKNLKSATMALRSALRTFQDRQMRQKVGELGREFGLVLREHGAHEEAAEFLAAVLAATTLGSEPRSPVNQ